MKASPTRRRCGVQRLPWTGCGSALMKAAMIAGAVGRTCELTREHVQTREQFGRPLIALQTVAHRLADMVCQRDLAEAALHEALACPERQTASAALIVAVEGAEIVA